MERHARAGRTSDVARMRPTIFLDIDGVLNRTTVRRKDGLVMRSVRSLICLPRLAPLLSLRRT